MSNDVALVIGLVMAILALPAALSAWSDDRRPIFAVVLAACAAALITWAQVTGEAVYGLSGIASAIFRVLAQILP